MSLKLEKIATDIQDIFGKTALIRAVEQQNNVDILIILRSIKYSQTLFIQDNQNKTALVYAVENDDLETCQILLNKCSELDISLQEYINFQDKNGKPLFIFQLNVELNFLMTQHIN
jgi:ankyrin repeat protein